MLTKQIGSLRERIRRYENLLIIAEQINQEIVGVRVELLQAAMPRD